MIEDLYAQLPHAGAMCLLDRIEHWDDSALVATTRRHRDVAHPLRQQGRLHALAGLEYAAQACALHGVLLGRLDSAQTAGGNTVVATVQLLECASGDLDRAGVELRAEVRCVLRQSHSAIYESRVSDGEGWLLTASLGLMLSSVN